MSEEKRTRELIGYLAKDSVRESRTMGAAASRLRLTGFSLHWLFGAAIVLALSIWLLPEREDLRERLNYISTYFVIVLWFLAALLPATKVYSLAFPEGRLAGPIRGLAKFAAMPLVLLAAWSLANLSFKDFGFQFYRESSHLNGGCGMVIFVAGMIQGSFLFSWIRKGATTSPARAGAWAAVSTASFASFIVQFACPNENSIHVLLWHFVPLLFLTGVAALSAKRFFRWQT